MNEQQKSQIAPEDAEFLKARLHRDLMRSQVRIISRKTETFGEGIDQTYQLTAKVKVTAAAKKEMQQDDRSDYWDIAFNIAEVHPVYSGGPGRSFIGEPSYHFEGLTLVIHQWGGMDV